MDPKGKVALLTGGRASDRSSLTALRCAGAIWRWSIAARARRRKLRPKPRLAQGVRAITIRADATDEDQIAEAVKETHRALGRIDMLLNMASIYLSTLDPNEADWSNAVNTNARSVFLFSTSAAPIMKQGRGARIINFADWLPASGRPRYRSFVPYYNPDNGFGHIVMAGG